jgi:hypothetical protein
VIFRCTTSNAGCYTKGEKPAPWQYQFQDASGAPLPGGLNGFTVKLLLREQWADPATAQLLAGSVADPTLAIVQYVWIGTEWTTPGSWLGQFWIGNGVQKYASVILTHTVAASIGPVPTGI